MKKLISLATIITIFSSTQLVNARESLSVESMNRYTEQCYQQTLLLEQKVDPNSLSTSSCRKVLQSTWLAKDVEANTRLNRGLVYLYQGKLDKALRDFQRAVAAEPTLYYGHLALGKLLLSQNKLADSIFYFDKALTINKEDQKVVRKRALVAKLYNESQTQLLSMHNPSLDKQ